MNTPKTQVFDALKSRRAIKQFDAEHVMSEADELDLLSLAILSPTAFNIQHWRFVVVNDAELRAQIREVAWDQAQVTDSSLFIVMTADTKAWSKQPERYWKEAPQGVQDFMLPAIKDYYEGKPQVQRDECMRSLGIAAQTLMLSAQAKGYESCPMDGFDFDTVAKLIKLPEDHVIGLFVAIGKGTAEPHPRGGQLSLDQVVVKNHF
jgi:nitroreductase